MRRWGCLDGVVANLGSGTSLPGYHISPDQWRDVMNLNFFGSAELARCCLSILGASGGTLTFVSSIAGVEAIGAPIAYQPVDEVGGC